MLILKDIDWILEKDIKYQSLMILSPNFIFFYLWSCCDRMNKNGSRVAAGRKSSTPLWIKININRNYRPLPVSQLITRPAMLEAKKFRIILPWVQSRILPCYLFVSLVSHERFPFNQTFYYNKVETLFSEVWNGRVKGLGWLTQCTPYLPNFVFVSCFLRKKKKRKKR